jgi:DNA-binding XRE family transcriptional regulator
VLRTVQHMPDTTTADLLAARLREIRGDRSMAEMAEIVNVTRQTWWKLENGLSGLPRDHDAFAQALGFPRFADLFTEAA